MSRLRIDDYGDSALLVRSLHPDREHCWRTVHRLADALGAGPPSTGVRDLVATYDCLLVEFDCTLVGHAALTRAVRAAAAALDDTADGPPPRLIRVPVFYGGRHGPDLPHVADHLGLTTADVVRLHSSADWTVRFLGAPAGAPMLDGPALPVPVPRRGTPRPRVPGGSVAIAGAQCAVYPVDSPGGWRLIGRTPLRLVDSGRWPHVPYRPGDRVRFEPVGGADPT